MSQIDKDDSRLPTKFVAEVISANGESQHVVFDSEKQLDAFIAQQKKDADAAGVKIDIKKQDPVAD
jgi:hypothetical protein